MPSRPVAILTATLIGILYTLVPVGRWRQLGKWVATGLVAAFALARIHLGVDAPTDALLGAVIGVAVSVAAYRLFVAQRDLPGHLQARPQRPPGRRRPPWRGDPSSAGRPARADRARGRAVRPVRVGRVDPAADPGPGRAGTTRYVFGKLYAKSHLRADRSYKLVRALLYGRLEDEKPFNTVKRLVQQEDYALALMAWPACPARSRTVSPSSPPSGST